MTFSPQNSLAFQVVENVTFSKDQNQFLLQLTDLYTKLAKASNAKDMAIYDLTELLNGQRFFTVGNPQVQRSVYRKCFTFTGNPVPIPHGITGITTITRLYGSCITAADQRPLPYVDVTNVTNQISIVLNGANIVITRGATAPAIVSGLVICEFLKS